MNRYEELLKEPKEVREQPIPPRTISFTQVPPLMMLLLVFLFLGSLVFGFYFMRYLEGWRSGSGSFNISSSKLGIISNDSSGKDFSPTGVGASTTKETEEVRAKNLAKERERREKANGSSPKVEQPKKDIRVVKTRRKLEVGQKGKTKSKEILNRERLRREGSLGDKSKVETVAPKEWVPLKDRALAYNLLSIAEEARRKGNYKEAIALYEEYLSQIKNPDVYNNLGSLYFLVGNYQRAESCFQEALSIRYDPIYEINYYLALYKSGRRELACYLLFKKEFPEYLSGQVSQLRNLCEK